MTPTPEELVAAAAGDVARFAATVSLPAAEWESVRDRGDVAWGVGAAVVDAGRLLLVRQRGQWLLPGGMLEPDERHAEGAAREVYEETGVPVEVTGLGAVVEQTFRNAATDEAFDVAFVAFHATPEHTRLADDPGLEGEAIEDVAWHGTVPADTFQREMVTALFEG
ncbi:NUDIX domain-containing protein [Halomarina ordinaria]|uniref:NUDIX domain-containing protein n=1 Tax=Halomarina ordinaria TaxID=3033939 RepID=A0ABD5UAR5_9EURY|nr:NUDIX domain-containing protein [Halomarina sp. PSRA2]